MQRPGLLCVLFGFLILMVGRATFTMSPTTDEMAHLPAGLATWQLRRFELYRVNPPLPKMVAAIPVLFMDPTTDWRFAAPRPGERNEFELGRQFMNQNSGRAVRFFQAARLACLPFVALGFWVCCKWAGDVYGRSVAPVAGWLWCFSPLILGHGSLITPDVPAAATGILAVYRFRRWLLAPIFSNAAILGVCTGAALLTKFTWAPIFPLVGFLGCLLWRIDKGCGSRSYWRVITRDGIQLMAASCVALLLINSVYGFDRSFNRLGDFDFYSADFRGAADGDHGSAGHSVNEKRRSGNRFRNSWMAPIPVPLPACYLEGIDLQRRDFEPGQMRESYLAGEWKQGGWWYYYIAGVALKEPVGFLAILALSLVMWKRDLLRRLTGGPHDPHDGVQFRSIVSKAKEEILLLAPVALVFWLVSRETGFNHHVRYVIPALPFLFVFASRAMAKTRSNLVQKCIVACLLWQLGAVLWAGPHWLSYFNSVAGGPARGDAWLLDSNIDWGQDLLNLQAWKQKHPEARPLFGLLYSRYDPACVGHPVRFPRSSAADRNSQVTEQQKPGGSFSPEPGWYAISVSQLQPHRPRLFNLQSMQHVSECWQWFARQTPVDRVGYSIRIYHVPGPQHEDQ